jgi:hypothetical protein
MKPVRMLFPLFAFMSLAAAAQAATVTPANRLDINLDDNAVRAAFMTPITPTGLYASVSAMHNSDRGDVANAGIQLLGDAGVGPNPLHAGIGGQFFYVNPKHSDLNGEAVALGGFVEYQLPKYNRFSFGGHVYYSPNIISFGDMERYFEYGVRAGYQVLQNANVYVGYRQIKADFDGPGGFFDMDSGFHVGVSLTF